MLRSQPELLYKLCNGLSAEELAVRFPTLGQEQIYATVLYYLQNREKIGNYLNEWIEHGKQMRESQEKNPPPVIVSCYKMAAGCCSISAYAEYSR